jgi:IS5 family transposase
MTQMGFFDFSDRCASLDAQNDPLIEIVSALGSEEFRAKLERAWRKPMDSVLMFKTLVLSALYNLSDYVTFYSESSHSVQSYCSR